MDGDLSLSQSLGGLRIANPDDSSSPPPTGTDAPSLPSSDQTLRADAGAAAPDGAVANGSRDNAESHIPLLPPERSERPLSQLDFDPSSYSISNIVTTPPAQPLAHNDGAFLSRELSGPPRKESRQPPPPAMLNYAPPQQPAYSQYLNPATQPGRAYQTGGRPPSSVYPNQPGPPGHPAAPARDESYRLHKANSQSELSGTPRKHAARAAAVMQAGVPSREGSHSDRAYMNTQVPRQNGALPPRRSSRGMGSGGVPPQGIEGAMPRTREEWQERGAAQGMRQEIDTTGKPIQRPTKKGVTDFTFGRELGQGSYSTVVMATDRQTGREYAIKILDKRHIIKEKKVKYVNIEKDTLNQLTEHPGVVRLYYTFQDQTSLYFVLDIAANGELLGVLKRMGTFDEECTRFYAGQILDTIDYMHSQGVIHRDLKPENVLLDDGMHIKITDFGTAKILEPPKPSQQGISGVPLADVHSDDPNRAVSFVGTAEYVSPELLTEKNAGKPSDLWAFGCIVYQLLAGRPPFKAGTEYLTFQKIVALDYSFPAGFPPVARDLVERLLVLDPTRRLTIDHVKNHEFFDGISWGRGLWQQKAPKLRSFQPAGPGTIKLNGVPEDKGPAPYPDVATAHSTKPIHISTSSSTGAIGKASRPHPRVITEIPPPSQLDIEWSPVLTRNNERIIKFSNQLVLTTAAPASPSGGKGNNHSGEGNKFTRFFGGGTNKKRQRLVMITSSGRVLICGDDKKTKFEISLLDEGIVWKKLQDPKGLSYWMIETPDKHFTFEELKASTSDSSTTSATADDWLEHIEKARDVAMSQSLASSYSGDEAWREMRTGGAGSSSNTLDRVTDRHANDSASSSRHTLQKFPSSNTAEELRGFKRFSKRQSKSGLAAVF